MSIKSLDICFICNETKDNLRDMHQDHCVDGSILNYTDLLVRCFKINLFCIWDYRNKICEMCIAELKNCFMFRAQVEFSCKSYMQTKFGKELKTESFPPPAVSKSKLKKLKDTKSTSKCQSKVESKDSPDSVLKTTESLVNKIKFKRKLESNRSSFDKSKKYSTSSDREDSPSCFLYENENDSANEIFVSSDESSANSEQMKLATGYKNQSQSYRPPKFVIPELDPSTLECPICCMSFEYHHLLTRHYNFHFPDFLCEMCGQPFKNKTGLLAHLNSHYGIKSPCLQCGRKYKSQATLRNHILTYHEKKKLFKCYECKMEFALCVTRKQHLFAAHGIKSQMYPCTLCEKKFFSPHLMRRHIKKSHLKVKDYACDVCAEEFCTKTNLEDHMAKHTGIRKHYCEFCGKTMASKKSLKEHLKIHNNIKNFKCDICGKAFVQKCALNGHMKTHFKNT